MTIFFIAVLILGILSAYAARFQEATHHWGRIIAGQQSLEFEIDQVMKSDKDVKEKKYQESYLRNYAKKQNGFQDAITPRMQNLRNSIHLISMPAILIVGFIFFKWYFPLVGLITYIVVWSNFTNLLPSVNSLYFKKRIIRGLITRGKWFDLLNKSEKADATIYFIEQLEDAVTDSAIG